jgi:hypothetical protein
VHQYKVQILRWDLPDTTVGEAEDFFQEGSIMSPLSHSRPEIVVDDASDIAIPFRDAAPLEHLADK